jgi:transposase-like protein
LHYSESFKLQVVREIETGRFANAHAASERYGIRGAATVGRWLRRYGKNHLIGKVVRVETTKERDIVKGLKDRVRELERILADREIEVRLERAFAEIACEVSGIDLAELKKKHAGMPPIGSLRKTSSPVRENHR